MDQPVADADFVDKLQALAKDGAGHSASTSAPRRSCLTARSPRSWAQRHQRGLQEGRARHRAGRRSEARPALSEGSKKSGFVVSAAMHGALLGCSCSASRARRSSTTQPNRFRWRRSTQDQFNEIMHGENATRRRAKAPAEPPPPPGRRRAAPERSAAAARAAARQPPPAPDAPAPPPRAAVESRRPAAEAEARGRRRARAAAEAARSRRRSRRTRRPRSRRRKRSPSRSRRKRPQMRRSRRASRRSRSIPTRSPS